jgi:hypothetical protein
MENKHSAYWDGWLSQRDSIPHEDNPYDEVKQAFSNREWSSGYWARTNTRREGLFIDSAAWDFYALNGERY